MNCDVSWKFSAPLRLVDVKRILDEAGPYAKCVRTTIDGKVYTLVNSKRVGVLPDPAPIGELPGVKRRNSTDGYPLTDNLSVVRADNGKVALVSEHLYGEITPWVCYVGDRTKEIVDRVKVEVEVYK